MFMIFILLLWRERRSPSTNCTLLGEQRSGNPGDPMYQEFIDLSHIPSDGLKIQRKIHPNAWKIAETDWFSRGELEFEVSFRGNAQKAEVDGWFTAGITANCHRCLKSFPLDLKRTFHLTYLAADPERFAKEEVELSGQELEVAYLEGEHLPLHEMIQEQIYLSMPMKFLCKQICKGLCVHCGGDLNEVECECPSEEIDPRWAKLKTVLDKSK
jgi:uncharacterized protein